MAHASKSIEKVTTNVTKNTALVVQPKLTINEPKDVYEQEADDVAERVMRTRTPSVSYPIIPLTISNLQRKESGTPNGFMTAPYLVSDVILSQGQSLDKDTQEFMGNRIGHDFSPVRIHTDSKAAESAQSINAKAYASGNHIVFGKGEYQPHTEGGKRLLAHELVHTVQQVGKGQNIATKPNDTFSNIVQRTPKPTLVGPASTIPEDRGDIERGYFATTEKIMYGVRASGLKKPEGLWIDHLFDTQKEAEVYAQALAENGETAIREDSALPYAWKSKEPGGKSTPGNPVTHVFVVEVPSGANYIQGVVKKQPEGSKMTWLKDRLWLGGGPQTVLSWDTKTKAVASFEVVKPKSQPIPPPHDYLHTQPESIAPPSLIKDFRNVPQYLIDEYNGQKILYNISRLALDNFEAKEKQTALSEEEIKAKQSLTTANKAAEMRMLQARKDFDTLSSTLSSQQQLQEVFARRSIMIPVGPQTEKTGAEQLKDSGLSSWALNDKGFTKKTGVATTQTIIGADDRPHTFTNEESRSRTVGFLSMLDTKSNKSTAVSGDKSVTHESRTTESIDLTKLGGSHSKESVTDVSSTSTKTTDKTTYTAGIGGITKTKENIVQVGSKLDSSTSSTVSFTPTPGQLGLSGSQTTKSGTMVGLPGSEKLDKGTEKTNKASGGLVSDSNGIGLGGTVSQDRKTLFGDGKSVFTNIAAGGKFQALVKEIPDSDPVKFSITTLISFDFKLGATADKEWADKFDAQKTSGMKGNASIGGGASIGLSASFKRELTKEEALKYVAFINENGRGSKLPEHMILSTGVSQSWNAAKKLWQSLNGSPDMLKSLKPDEEINTNFEVGGDATLGAGGGESNTGGLAIGLEAAVKAKHKINVKQAVMPDGKIQVTAVIDDEGELGGIAKAGFGEVGMKGGKSITKGAGRTIVFILDPKDPAFNSQLEVINGAATWETLDRIARQNHSLVSSKTDKSVDGDGTTLGMNIGLLAIDLSGKGTLVSEVTRDKHGKVIGSKFTGENEGGGTWGVRSLKVGDSVKETGIFEVTEEGEAKGELSKTKKSSSLRKTSLNIGKKLSTDPLGVLLNLPKIIEEETEQQGTAIDNSDIMSICYSALDRNKWNSKVGGHRHDDWVATGIKIRKACSIKDGTISNVDKHAVQQALAEWTKADVEGRKEVLDYLIRPLGGLPSGKAFAFPDGTDYLKPEWDKLIVADPLIAARSMKPNEALSEMRRIKDRANHLYISISSSSHKWQGLETQHAEMLGHINTRVNEITGAIQNVTKQIPSIPSTTAGITTVPTAEQAKEAAKHEAAVQKMTEVKAWLETYNNNISIMQGYANAVFGQLGKVEARLNESGIFVASKLNRLIEVQPQIKMVDDQIKLWDALYWSTYRLYEQISPYLAIEKARLEKLHTAGAKDRSQQIHNLFNKM